jgi:lipid-binding SYLF domain-containing protein
LLSSVGLAGSLAWAGTDREDVANRLNLSTEVLQSLMETPDKGIPEEVMNSAKCVMVVPHLLKGGFIFGAEHGRGVATCRTATGWSAPAFIAISGGSWGLQIGVEGIDLVMLVMNDKGMQHLLSSKFEVGGEGSASAGPVGRQAAAGTDWKMESELLTYSRSKGAFAGLTLEGTVVEQDNDATRVVYGKTVPFRNILSGRVHSPKIAGDFLRAVAAAGRQSHAAESKEQASSR